jgi:hypothetical protein
MLINLGTVYSNMGRKDEVGTLYVHELLFSKAELLYSESLKIIKKLLGPEDISCRHKKLFYFYRDAAIVFFFTKCMAAPEKK